MKKRKQQAGQRPVGRPKGSGTGINPVRFYRMSDTHFALIERAAELLGTPIADYQRDTLLRRSRKILREHGET